MTAMVWPETHEETLLEKNGEVYLGFYAPEKNGTFTAFFQYSGEDDRFVYGVRKGLTQNQAVDYLAKEKRNLLK